MSQFEMLQIPDLLKPFINEAWLTWSVPESKATCARCPMVQKGIFRAQLKCCTFQPELVNFQVGYVLHRKPELWPTHLQGNGLGLKPSEEYRQVYKTAQFGSEASLLCAFHHDNACAIWEARPSSCVSYICESEYGTKGTEFWKKTGDLLHSLEMSLAQEALLAHGFSWPEVERCLKGEPEWAHWSHDPQKLFLSAYKWLCALRPSEIEEFKQKVHPELESAYLALEE